MSARWPRQRTRPGPTSSSSSRTTWATVTSASTVPPTRRRRTSISWRARAPGSRTSTPTHRCAHRPAQALSQGDTSSASCSNELISTVGPTAGAVLPVTGRSLPKLMAGAGYATGLVGKWHLGFKPEAGPRAHGFGYFWGYLSGYLDFSFHVRGDGRPGLVAERVADDAPGLRPPRDHAPGDPVHRTAQGRALLPRPVVRCRRIGPSSRRPRRRWPGARTTR